MVALVRCQASVRCPKCERATVPGQVLASVDDELRHLVCPEPSNLAGHMTPAGEAPVPDETPSSPSPGPGAFLRGEAA